MRLEMFARGGHSEILLMYHSPDTGNLCSLLRFWSHPLKTIHHASPPFRVKFKKIHPPPHPKGLESYPSIIITADLSR